jgi:hypothetical protein
MKLPTIHRDAKGRFILTRGKTGKLRRLYIKRGLSRDALIKWLINLILKKKKRTRKQGQVKGRQPSKQSIPYVPSERRIESEKKEAEESYERGVRQRNEMTVNTPHGKVVVSKSPDEEVGFVHGPGTYTHGPGGLQVTTPGPKRAPYIGRPVVLPPTQETEEKYSSPKERKEDFEIDRSRSRAPSRKEEKIPSAPPAPLSANKPASTRSVAREHKEELFKKIEQHRQKLEKKELDDKLKHEESMARKKEELERIKQEALKREEDIKIAEKLKKSEDEKRKQKEEKKAELERKKEKEEEKKKALAKAEEEKIHSDRQAMMDSISQLKDKVKGSEGTLAMLERDLENKNNRWDKFIDDKTSRGRPVPQNDIKTHNDAVNNLNHNISVSKNALATYKDQLDKKLALVNKTGSGIRSEKGLSDLDINKVMDRYKPMGYLGVVMCDEIPKLVPRVHPRSRISFVMNTDPASKEGRHWVSVYCDCRDSTPSPSLEYYNSFGTPPSQTFLRDIKPLMEKMNPKQYPRFKVNKIADQSNSSTNCGSFAMKFLIRRYRGEPFTEVTGYDDSRRGEKGIERFKHEEKIGSGKFPLMLV